MIRLRIWILALWTLALTGCCQERSVTLKPGWYTVAIFDERDNLIVAGRLGDPIISTVTIKGLAIGIYPVLEKLKEPIK